MSYPKNLKICDCGIQYMNGTYHKRIDKKSKTHKYVKFSKLSSNKNEEKKNDNNRNNDDDEVTIKIEVSQDCKSGEFLIETSENKQLYKSTSDGKWSLVEGKRPFPQFLPYYVITQYFPSLDNDNNDNNKKKKKGKKKKRDINKSNNRFNYNENNDNDEYDDLFRNYKHYIKDVRVTDRFVLFYKDVFSQWFPAKMIIDNVEYQTCEQYMMTEKARLFNDDYYLNLILNEKDPSKIKKYGRGIRGFNETKWRKHREQIVYKGNMAKFTQNEILKKKLLGYNSKLIFVEASGVDKIWGIGLKVTDPAAQYQRNWKGLNLLGQAITKVRDHIINQQ